MRRALWVVAVGVVVGGGCKKDERDRPEQPGTKATARDDAGSVPGPRFDLEAIDALEPKGPAPEPIVVDVPRGDCSTGYAPRPDRDRSPMCKVDGGSFMMGNPDGTGDDAPRRVEVDGFYMDQHEVTVAQYAHFLNALGTNEACPDSYGGLCVDYVEHPEALWQLSDSTGRFVPREGMERHPILQISAEGLLKYCHWVGKRAPTEAEWEYAARHDPVTGKDFHFPWGDELEPGRANCAQELCNDEQDGLGPVGSDWGAGVGAGASPWGIVDMAGNAIEMVLTCDDPIRLSTCVPQERGGDHSMPFPVRLSGWKQWENVDLHGGMLTGFRCARDP